MTPAPGPTERRGYAICSEPRSGTTYLCDLLTATGLLGDPLEYFNPTGVVAQSIPDYGPARMIDTVLTRGATVNGVYAVKVFTDTFNNPDRPWCQVLPNLRYVHFERLDLLGQAISWARAVQTGLYMTTDRALGEPRYDQAVIAYFLVEGARRHARWRLFFARNGLAPLRMTYEATTADPAAAVAQIAALVDVPAPQVDLTASQVAVQRDALSQDWRERFLRETGDLDHLDAPDISADLALRRTASRVRQKLSRLMRR